MTRIYAEDTHLEMARKIFDGFEVGQQCTVEGFVRDEENKKVWIKAEMVLDELRQIDTKENVVVSTTGKRARKRKVMGDSIGGYLAQKIFRFKKVAGDKYSIWRFQ